MAARGQGLKDGYKWLVKSGNFPKTCHATLGWVIWGGLQFFIDKLTANLAALFHRKDRKSSEFCNVLQNGAIS